MAFQHGMQVSNYYDNLQRYIIANTEMFMEFQILAVKLLSRDHGKIFQRTFALLQALKINLLYSEKAGGQFSEEQKSAKDQLISKCRFGVFNFFQKLT